MTTRPDPHEDHETRVILRNLEIESEQDTTFINASYVARVGVYAIEMNIIQILTQLQKKYIAAAMPHNLASERDFWR